MMTTMATLFNTKKMATRLLLLPFILAQQRSAMAAGWSWHPVSAAAAPRVSGHTTASINDGNNDAGVLLFGGLTGPAGTPTTNDLWRFNPTNNKWELFSPDVSPRVRMYAASAMLENKFYIFGGWDPGAPGSGGEFLNDIWSFDYTTKSWSEEEAKLPYPVSRHAAVTVDDMIVIHTFKGVLIFKDGKVTEQETKGNPPRALSMCAMTATADGKVVLFGGADKSQQMSPEVYVLDTASWTWIKHGRSSGDGDGPTALASACMAPLSEKSCILFGGAGLAPSGYEGGYGLQPKDEVWICNLHGKSVEWELIDCGNERKPEARLAASLNCLGKDTFLLQGGYDSVSKATFEEPWILSRS